MRSNANSVTEAHVTMHPRTLAWFRGVMVVLLAVLLVPISYGCAKKSQVIGDGRRIRHVRFEGARGLSKSLLLKHLFAGETRWIPFTPNYPFDEALTGVDTRRLVDLYRSYGFFQARVEGLEVVPVKNRKGKVDLILKLHEGPQARVRTVTFVWEPDAALDPEARAKVEALARLDVDGPWETPRLGETVGNLRQRLMQLGFPTARVLGRAEVDEDALLADVVVDIDPGPHAVIGRVVLEGLVKVRERDIEPDVRFAVGKPYSPALVRQVEQALQGARVFRWVSARPVASVEDGRADLAIRLDEADPQSLRVGAQLTMENVRWQQHVRLDYSHPNLFGNLTRLDLKTIAGWAEIPVPWNLSEHGPVLEIAPTLSKKGFLEDYLYWEWTPSFELDLEEGYQFWAVHNRMGVSRWFAGRLLMGLSYNLRFFDFFRISPALDNKLTPLGRDFRDPFLLSYLELRCALYLTDSILKPANGIVLEVLYQLAGLGGHFNYNRLVGTLTGYLRLARWLDVAGRFRVGSILTYGSRAGTPISERFYLGGSDTVRGWGARRVSPRLRECGDDGDCRSIPVGGFTAVQSNFEMRFRVWGPLSLIAFLDAGDVQAGQGSFRPSEWNFSAGPGVRYDSPVGLIRLDAGFRLNDPGVYDEPFWAVHFGWGEAF